MSTGIRRVPPSPKEGLSRGQRFARLRDRLADDRGSLTAAVVLWTPIVMILTAFVVDTGFLISQRDRASDLADQAARRVADDLNLGYLRGGTDGKPSYVVNVDTDGSCKTDAQDYLNASGVDPATTGVDSCEVRTRGGNAVPGNITVTVKVHLIYRPLFAGMVMPGPVTVTGDGTAHPATG